MDFFKPFGLSAKINGILLLLTIFVLFVLVMWLGIPATKTLFYGVGLSFAAIAVMITALISLFAAKSPRQEPDGGADDN